MPLVSKLLKASVKSGFRTAKQAALKTRREIKHGIEEFDFVTQSGKKHTVIIFNNRPSGIGSQERFSGEVTGLNLPRGKNILTSGAISRGSAEHTSFWTLWVRDLAKGKVK